MAFHNSGRIVTSGLVLSLDAADRNSYVSGSTTWFDLSGNNNSGSLVNGPTFSSDNGGSIVFDGQNDYVDLGTTSISTTLSSLTLSLVLKISNINTKQAIISSYTSIPQGGWGIELLTNNTFNFFGFSDTTNFTGVQTVQTYSLNQIVNIACVYGSSIFTIYVNGAQMSSNSGVSTIYRTSTIRLGSAPPTAVIPFQGSIYATQIYNRALSAQEVKQNYDAMKSRFNLT